MGKEFTNLTGEELKYIIDFLNEKIIDFTTFKIPNLQLPENFKWSTDHFEKRLSISLNIEKK